MKKNNLLKTEFIVILVLCFFVSFFYLQKNSFFENLNKNLTDYLYMIRGEKKPSNNVIIVDIDEKSLKKLGQWPWSRDKVAKILQNLTNANVGIVGLDIVFAETDNSSPKIILNKLGLHNIKAPDFDKILADTLLETPTITGYIFDFKEEFIRGSIPNIPAIIIEKGDIKSNILPRASGIITNIPLIQTNSFSSGFFNTIPDSDGIVRSVPLLVKFKDTVYPSLSLEILRLVYGSNKIVINYIDTGVESVSIGKKNIKTDKFGRVALNYYGKSKLFKYISAVDIFDNKFKKEDIEGKIVLIGTSASGLLDLRATPLESTYAGVEIHATAIENIINDEYLKKFEFEEIANLSVIWLLLILILIFFKFFNALKSTIFSASLVAMYLVFVFWLFESKMILINIIYPLSASIGLYMFLSSIYYFFETKQKELIKKKFSKKVSLAVAETLINEDTKDVLEPKEREVSIFFSDIRGFTSISEKLQNPKKVIDFLNFYMTPMAEIITKNGGTIDKFIGDAIMAYWNAPLEVKNHADMAIKSAISQIKRLKKLNIELKKLNFPCIDIGIGINTGLVVVGEMGSSGRSDYTIIGDSVNLASRVEGLCKTYKTNILITEFTKNSLKEEYNIEFVDEVKVRGKKELVKIYKVVV
jgi:adenylate cyclase